VMMGLDLCFQEIRDAVGSKGVWVPSLRNGTDDQVRMLESLGKLYCLGLNPSRVTEPEALVRLPTYRFDRQRCWSAAAERGQHIAAAAAPANPAASLAPVAAYSSGSDADIHRVMLEHMAVVEQYLALTERNR
jgi:acyl transferase domain-containing protein